MKKKDNQEEDPAYSKTRLEPNELARIFFPKPAGDRSGRGREMGVRRGPGHTAGLGVTCLK